MRKIKDPRNPKKIKHKLTVLIRYGLLAFVFQISSRKEANKTMSRPVFLETLQQLFPELESLPHADTLGRLLERINVSDLERAHIAFINQLIRNKKFRRFLVNSRYSIAIDGTQKLIRDGRWYGGVDWLEKIYLREGKEIILQYIYVLEANLVFPNGLTVPLLSEFLSYDEGDPNDKQDCELKAFKRLASRLKEFFPHLSIMVLLDGLYPNGPLMELCQRYKWEYMIVLPKKCLPSVWKEYKGLAPLQKGNHLKKNWKGRHQYFEWVNNILYHYDNGQGKKNLLVHVVICHEKWETVDRETGKTIQKQSRHVWISSHPIRQNNVHDRCNLTARYRWGIEISMLVEKRQGYYYEHPFSSQWNAMKCYHYLMRLAHLINAIAQHTTKAINIIKQMGVQSFMRFVRETCANPWLTSSWIKTWLETPFQIRLEYLE